MEFKEYIDVGEFYDAVYNVLMRDEAQNLVPLGNLLIGYEGKDKAEWRNPANWYMATVSDDTGVRLTALMTPPHNLTLYATDNAVSMKAMDCLIEGMKNVAIPGVMAEKNIAKYFADAYTPALGMTYEIAMDQRIYELTAVNPDIPQIGTLRLLEEKDMSFFPFWYEAFSFVGSGDVDGLPLDDPEKYHYRIAKKSIYILEVDGVPVSMAGLGREMENVVGVGPVFTPPYYRGKGYASSAVAQVSQIALDKGFTKCVLYTDLTNPTSNSIYQKIGYEAICDSLMLKFVPQI
jgi:predicted GNAT family acetyltransferase